MRYRIEIVLTVGLAAGALMAPGAAGARWEQRVQMRAGLPVVAVWAENAGPFRFAIDTGAEGTTVSTGLARRLGLVPFAAVEIQTVAGVRKLPVARWHGLRLAREGPEETVEVALSDLAALRSAGPLDGVLGSDVLSRYDYLLDFSAGRLVLARGEAIDDPGGVTLPLELHRGRPIVHWPSPARHASHLPLALDTGSDAIIVTGPAAAVLPCRRDTHQRGSVETHAGAREATICELDRVTLGDVTLRGLRMVVLPEPLAGERPDVGLLPASAFERMHVSPRNRTVTLWAADPPR